jgi:hypothetical protein
MTTGGPLAELLAAVRRLCPGAVYWPPGWASGSGEAIELPEDCGGGWLPNVDRARRWLAAQPPLPSGVAALPPASARRRRGPGRAVRRRQERGGRAS